MADISVVTANGAGLDTSLLSLSGLTDADITIEQESATSYRFSLGTVDADLTGTGFGYAGDLPLSGHLTGATFDFDGAVTVQISGLDIDIGTLVGEALRGDTSALGPSLFYGGDDLITGSGFNDTLHDELGNNVLIGGGGSDTLIGGNGNDHLYGQSAAGGTDGGDLLEGAGGSDYVQGNAGNDTISGGDGSDRLNGGADEDRIGGDGGNDSINGNRGDDSINGGDGNDSLRGGQGNDTLIGGNGNDVLMGDLGADQLTGGAGADIFVFAPGTSPFGFDLDTITDFQHGTDHIALGFTPVAVLAAITTAANPDAARTAAQALFDQHGGDHEVGFVNLPDETLMLWASDGGTTIDSVVVLNGVTAVQFNASDFV